MGFSQPRDQTPVSCIAGTLFNVKITMKDGYHNPLRRIFKYTVTSLHTHPAPTFLHVHRHTTIYNIDNKDLLYGIGNSIQHPVVIYMGKESEKMNQFSVTTKTNITLYINCNIK